MPGEKKRVNLVNLKTKFGHFLDKYYSCTSCYSMDKLVFGFTCEHRLCTNCNDNFTDQCKMCKAEIEDVYQDGLQNKLFPRLEDLKNLMNIDLKKVANKLKLQQTNVVPVMHSMKAKKIADAKNEDRQPEQENVAEDAAHAANQQRNQDENDEEPPVADRSSKRQSKRRTAEKASEPNKNSSAVNESKKNNSNVEQPVKNKSANEPEIVAAVKESKVPVRTRESSRSKESRRPNDDSIKESRVAERQPEIEKSALKSTRKAARPAKATEVAKPSQLVIISTSITDAELLLLKKFAKRFNAKIVNDFSDDITHLVTLEAKDHPNRTTRTLKYLKSLLSHKWLLNFNWIRSSLDNDELANESDFELLGITKQTDDQLGAPRRSRENPVGLFEGKQFYIDGKFGPKSGLPKSDYRDLVVVGGGEVIESEKSVQDDTYIIIDAATLNKSKYKERANAISTTNFLNCVSDFRFLS